MEKAEFESKMNKAQTLKELGQNTDYWTGYMSGLKRRYHGENFRNEKTHEMYMSLNDDSLGAETGRGYRDGFIPVCCTQNDGDCRTCPLVNDGRDCRNEPIEHE